MLFPCCQRPQRQQKTPLHKASIVREARRARWGSGVSLSRCHSSVGFLSLFPPSMLSAQQNISLRRSCNKIPVHTLNPLLPLNHPSPSFPLSSLKSLHSSLQLSSGKRLALWGRGSRAALMRRRCRALCVCADACVCVCMW